MRKTVELKDDPTKIRNWIICCTEIHYKQYFSSLLLDFAADGTAFMPTAQCITRI